MEVNSDTGDANWDIFGNVAAFVIEELEEGAVKMVLWLRVHILAEEKN